MKLMRTLIPVVLLLALFAMPGATQTAQAQTKIATVDMSKLLNGYWKTKQAQLLLDNSKTDMQKTLKDMADGLQKAETDYKALLVQAQDPAISDVERDRRKQAAADKNKEINQNKTALDEFNHQAEIQMQEKVQRITSNLVADIKAAVGAKAKLAGYALVLNTGGEVGSSAITYSSGELDITADVLAQLNAGAPIDVNAATNTAPSSGHP
jgi:Skp family chaperone for outer membrane proteins